MKRSVKNNINLLIFDQKSIIFFKTFTQDLKRMNIDTSLSIDQFLKICEYINYTKNHMKVYN